MHIAHISLEHCEPECLACCIRGLGCERGGRGCYGTMQRGRGGDEQGGEEEEEGWAAPALWPLFTRPSKGHAPHVRFSALFSIGCYDTIVALLYWAISYALQYWINFRAPWKLLKCPSLQFSFCQLRLQCFVLFQPVVWVVKHHHTSVCTLSSGQWNFRNWRTLKSINLGSVLPLQTVLFNIDWLWFWNALYTVLCCCSAQHCCWIGYKKYETLMEGHCVAQRGSKSCPPPALKFLSQSILWFSSHSCP